MVRRALFQNRPNDTVRAPARGRRRGRVIRRRCAVYTGVLLWRHRELAGKKQDWRRVSTRGRGNVGKASFEVVGGPEQCATWPTGSTWHIRPFILPIGLLQAYATCVCEADYVVIWWKQVSWAARYKQAVWSACIGSGWDFISRSLLGRRAVAERVNLAG